MTTAGDFLTTGIGSLPHHNVDAALEFSFRAGVPFLPQIPIRNPWEFMIPQALEGLPGLQAESDGTVTLNLDVWSSRTHEYHRKLNSAFEAPASDASAFEAFEPSPSTSSSWQPFLWECQERAVPTAKIQLAGPLTCQWSLRLKSGKPASDPDLQGQVYRHVLARAIAMVRRLKSAGVRPLIYLDEPGLYAIAVDPALESVGTRELGLMVEALKREGASVGIHCCSNTLWDGLLAARPDYLSLDVSLSLASLLESGAALDAFLSSGGRISLGIVPTSPGDRRSARELTRGMLDTLGAARSPELGARVLGISGGASRPLLTPACGLALTSIAEAEAVFDTLTEVRALLLGGAA